MRVILDVKTEGLTEAIGNLNSWNKIVRKGIEKNMKLWFRVDFTPRALKVIETGRPRARIPKNRGRYAEYKFQRYGFDHGLGRLSGQMYEGVRSAKARIKTTRAKEIRFSVDYRNPYYIAYVHDGTRNHIGRPFIEVARDISLPKLINRLNRMMDGVDLTQPLDQVVSSVLATK